MRILYLTDTHIRGTTPKNRKDNLLETLQLKFEEVLEISKKYNVDYILHGGDFFDRPDISNSIARKFALILSKFDVPIYVIAGNHDVYGHNPETLHRTLLGLFDALGILNLIDSNDKIILKKENIKVQITGQNYRYDIDTDKSKKGYIVKEKQKGVDYLIHVVHGMLLDRPFIKGIPYTLIEDIVKTKADITLCGHYHSGFGVIKIDNKYFVNPGSLIRITNSLQEIERKPKIAIIDLKKEINIDLIPLKKAKSGKEILDRKQIEMFIYRNERIMQFKQSIDSSSEFEKLDITHILNSLANTDGISKAVKDEAINRIGVAQMYFKGDDE
ncbi:metallophosphoesterase [Caldisalinibacter kiritimatiensis]|uniref:DNA double-strand break repair protein Mre11 n=1 Tax=Caldisalinibacter kiritimatiensis TaxID=1304284 RepID=R1AX50_9FIRM|nr:metallophosphoesterase [Caldisalinibacter kiritimatiensis]EOD01247.1 DNA double-strand break repair protein Mre11 [Caldisalinibacter kiritimatiensis]